MRSNNKYCLLIISVLLTFTIISYAFAQEEKTQSFSTAKEHWTFWGGYGNTVPGWGATETRIEDIDLIVQYGRFLTGEMGRSWYKGRHEILVEMPLYIVYNPETAVMTGVNFLACWDFTAFNEIVPYIFAGGGPMYTNLDIPGLGKEWNGNYQSGFGVHYFIENNLSIDFNLRQHHISNAGTADPNEPLNSGKILFGVSFFH